MIVGVHRFVVHFDNLIFFISVRGRLRQGGFMLNIGEIFKRSAVLIVSNRIVSRIIFYRVRVTSDNKLRSAYFNRF